MNYHTYTIEDFVLDEFFEKWVLNPDDESKLFWDNFLSQYPEKIDTIQEAKQIILLFGQEQKEISPERIQRSKNRIQQWMREHSEEFQLQISSKKKPTVFQLSPNSRIAAALLGLLTITFGIYLLFLWRNVTEEKSYSTKFGETQKIILPDGSQMNLNANSKVTYQVNKNQQDTREVWVNGEAYFQVSKIKISQANKKPLDQKFIVHTQDLDIEVIGTAFNVFHRREQTEVILNEGSVKLYLKGNADSSPILMSPSDKVIFSAKNQQFTKTKINPEKYLAWKNNTLILDEVSLKDIAQILKDNYGLTLIFKDKDLENKKFVGSIPFNNIDALFTALSKLYDIQVEKQGNQIILSKWIDE